MTATKGRLRGHHSGHAEKIVFQSSVMHLGKNRLTNQPKAPCARPKTAAGPAPTMGQALVLPDSPDPNPTRLIKHLIFNPAMLSSHRGGKS